MKIIVNHQGKNIGPYSEEELRELTYRGEVLRSSPAIGEGGAVWTTVDELLGQSRSESSASSLTPPVLTPPSLATLRDPNENLALVWLYVASIPAWALLVLWTIATFGLTLPFIGLIAVGLLVGELWFGAYIRTNAVRVSETQLPELFQIVSTCCKRIGMTRPEVYVMQHNVWNAFAAKILNRRMVVLLSGAVDSLLLKGDMRQLTWLIGHELGHHHARHLDFSRKLANLGGWCVWLRLWYSRRAELTCDRIGLYCTGSLYTSQLALMNATVGAQLAGKVNLQEAINQWQYHKNEFFVKYRTLYSTHPQLLARLAHLSDAAAELGVQA